MTNSSPTNWQDIVRTFNEELQQVPGQFFVKDVCNYLLTSLPSQKPWRDTQQIIEYLADWRSISLAKAEFHSKWAYQDSNLKGIADYDVLEAQKISELIDRLRQS